RFLLGQPATELAQPGGVMCLDSGRLRVLPFEELQQPGSGRIRTRMVDTTSEHYLVTREYMIRLGRRDLEDEAAAPHLAETAGMEVEQFRDRFRPAVDADALEASHLALSG